MKENRIVLPIPPGKHWSDELPFVLPGVVPGIGSVNALPCHSREGGNPDDVAGSPAPHARGRRKANPVAPPVPAGPKRGLWFATVGDADAKSAEQAETPTPNSKPKPKRERRRNDPKLIAAAREWRDRYLEQVNAGLILPGGGTNGKYDVSRQLEAAPSTLKQTPLLKAA
jgi:hypothetical protein